MRFINKKIFNSRKEYIVLVSILILITIVLLMPIFDGSNSKNLRKLGYKEISGSNYEVGYQLAKLQYKRFRNWEMSACKLFSGDYGKALRLAFEFQVTRVLENFPGLIREWQGIADAAKVSFDDIAVMMIGEKTIRRIAGLSISDDDIDDQFEACSAFGITHSDRGPILGKTSDGHAFPENPKIYDDDYVEILDYADSYKIMMIGYAILNDQGLVVGDANAHYYGTTHSGDGPGGKLAPIIARYCPNVDSAVSFIKKYQISDDGRHFCLVDRFGKAAAVEKGPNDLINIRWGDSTGYVYITNTSPSDSMRNHDSNNEEYRMNSDSRLANFERMFSDSNFTFTFASAESIIFSHDSIGAICQHGDRYDWQWHTNRSRLVLPAEGKIYFAARACSTDSWHPCENEWREYQLEIGSSIDLKPLVVYPERIKLHQNYPNPFNVQTTISYELVNDVYVEISIYNILGEKVRTLKDGYQRKGEYSIIWDSKDKYGNEIASSIYYYQLKTNDIVLTKQMTVIK